MLAWAAVLTLIATPTSPVSVTLSLPTSKDPIPVEVAARLVIGRELATPAIVRRVIVPVGGSQSRLEMTLGEGTWSLQASAADHWGPPIVIQTPAHRGEVALRLWRTTPLTLSVVTRQDEGPTA